MSDKNVDDKRVDPAPFQPIRLPELDPKIKFTANLVMKAAAEKAEAEGTPQEPKNVPGAPSVPLKEAAAEKVEAKGTAQENTSGAPPVPPIVIWQQVFGSRRLPPSHPQILLKATLPLLCALLLGGSLIASIFYLVNQDEQMNEARNRSNWDTRAKLYASSEPLPTPDNTIRTADPPLQGVDVVPLPPLQKLPPPSHHIVPTRIGPIDRPTRHDHRDAEQNAVPVAKSAHRYRHFADLAIKPAQRLLSDNPVSEKRRPTIFIESQHMGSKRIGSKSIASKPILSKRNEHGGSDGFPTEHIDPGYDKTTRNESAALP